MLQLLLAFVIFVAALAAVIVWMAGGVQRPHVVDGPIAEVPGTTTSTETETLDVLVWNIAWGYGWGSEGSGTAKASDHFETSIQKIGEVLRDSGADIVLLQEVDFGATRSHGVDQAVALAETAGFKYVAYAESWTANWVPFPYWPVSDHFGRMRSGGAILSRHQIVSNRVELLEKPAENPFWYNLFYLFRFFQTAEIQVGDRKIKVHNTHLDAFSRANRELQAVHIAAQIDGEDAVIFGGDLNSVPPESNLKNAYPDEPKTNHDGDPTVATMRSIDGLADTIPPETFSANQASLFTFPAHEPNRKLDHLFASGAFSVEAAGVHTAAGAVSDHLPVYAKLRFR